MRVKFSDAATAVLRTFASADPPAYVEINAAIKAVQVGGLQGELLIAVLNHEFDIYILEAAAVLEADDAEVSILLVADPKEADFCVVAAIGQFGAESDLEKRSAAFAAAAEVDITPTNIHVVP